MKKHLAIFALTLVAACAGSGGLQSVSPDTFNERLAVGYTTVTAVRTTATTLLTAKKLSADDGDNVLKTTDAARTGLDVARKLSSVDMNSAEGKLTAVKTGLTALEAYLAAKKGN